MAHTGVLVSYSREGAVVRGAVAVGEAVAAREMAAVEGSPVSVDRSRVAAVEGARAEAKAGGGCKVEHQEAAGVEVGVEVVEDRKSVV